MYCEVSVKADVRNKRDPLGRDASVGTEVWKVEPGKDMLTPLPRSKTGQTNLKCVVCLLWLLVEDIYL